MLNKKVACPLFLTGFTLIELLVVIVILGLLAGLLTSAIRGALDSAKTAACMNNLRQIYFAIEMYAQDHDGNWLGRYEVEPGGAYGSLCIWDGTKKEGVGLLYDQYLDNLDVFYCPASKKRIDTKDNFGKPGNMCYSSYYTISYGLSDTLANLQNRVLVGESTEGQPPMVSPHRKGCNFLYGNGTTKLITTD